METIFTKDKLAQSKAAYTIEANMLRPVSLQVDGDLGSEEITISYSDFAGTGLTDAYDSDGNLLVLSQTKPHIAFYAPAKIQIDKPVTTNDVGLNIVISKA